jgi:hypothetical protein
VLSAVKKELGNKINFADTSAYAHREKNTTTKRVEKKMRNMKNCLQFSSGALFLAAIF